LTGVFPLRRGGSVSGGGDHSLAVEKRERVLELAFARLKRETGGGPASSFLVFGENGGKQPEGHPFLSQ